DGAQLDCERYTGKLSGNCRESGHAEDHRGSTRIFDNFSSFTSGAFIRRMYALTAGGASAETLTGMRIASTSASIVQLICAHARHQPGPLRRVSAPQLSDRS